MTRGNRFKGGKKMVEKIDRSLLEEGTAKFYGKIPKRIKKMIELLVEMNKYYNVSNFIQIAVTEKIEKEIDQIFEQFRLGKDDDGKKLKILASLDVQQLAMIKKLMEMARE